MTTPLKPPSMTASTTATGWWANKTYNNFNNTIMTESGGGMLDSSNHKLHLARSNYNNNKEVAWQLINNTVSS
jgi:hypothetical protein